MASGLNFIGRLKALFFMVLFWVCYILVFVTRLVLTPITRSQLHLNSKRPKILYLATFFPNNAGYHYRVQLWADELRQEGYHVTIKNVFNERQFHRLRQSSLPHVQFYVMGMMKRYVHLLQSIFYHRVIVRREVLHFNDYGALFYEKLLLSIHPNAILDFDDDIAEAKGEPKNISLFGNLLLEHSQKFTGSLKLFEFFMVGSHYLKQYVLDVNPWIQPHQILVLPTCVDYDKYPPKNYTLNEGKINLGWIGSNNNQKYLKIIEDDIERLGQHHNVSLHIISGKPFTSSRKIDIVNHPWSIKEEITLMRNIDIGLMPLEDNKLQMGKCGFKLIQYMGLGIVGVATAIGANNEIVEENSNGFLIESGKPWIDTLEKLASNLNMLKSMGTKARETVIENYSIVGNRSAFLHFIQTLHADER